MTPHHPTEESERPRDDAQGHVRLEVRADEGFAAWMSRLPGCLLVSTYQADKLVLLGWDGRRVTVLPQQLDKPMGVAVKNLDGVSRADLVVGLGTGAGSRVTTYSGGTIAQNGTPPELQVIDASPGFAGGVFVG